ncbi:adhesion G- coupled receptor D1-like isoform X1 [Paramuricea clavata]|uniref:Adhesion G- coupled receptor D1-like isoform X1 n=1 Tax=Paramuricea clavata TaxID=317549 RepID=A0A7D9IIF1_PARCT|nr:adhesion G- coupled receptor D1-like isoform X1 [Paramuricea clavata]
MLCEGIIIYFQLVKVFSGMGLGGKHLKRFYVIGWGIPVVVVSVLVGVNDREDFITDDACWCGGDGVLFWVFVGTLGLIILVNLVIFILALRNTLSNCEVTSTSTQGSETTTKATVCTKLRKARIGLKGSAVLLPILGLTWVFGLLVFNRDTTVFKYLFAIFNSLQGLMIFVFHALLINRKMHEASSRESEARKAGPTTNTMADITYLTSLTNEETTGKSRIPVPKDITAF